MIGLYTKKITGLFFFTCSRGKVSQISNRMISTVYYFLITGLDLTVIDKPSPSILRVPISAVRGKIPQVSNFMLYFTYILLITGLGAAVIPKRYEEPRDSREF